MGTIAGATAIAGVATSIIGTGVSVYGASQQAAAQQKAANYQAQVAKNNATIAQQNAQVVQDQATNKAEADLRAGTLRAGAQRAQLGANGVDPNVGSAVGVTASTAVNSAITAQQDQYAGQLAGAGYLNQANNFNAQAGLDTAQGENAASAGTLNAFGSLLSGASQVSSKWDAWRNATTNATTNPFNGPGF